MFDQLIAQYQLEIDLIFSVVCSSSERGFYPDENAFCKIKFQI